MSQLSPQSIRSLCRLSFDHDPMIMPFSERTVHEATGLTGGLSCAGYDIHLSKLTSVLDDDRRPTFLMPIKTEMVDGVTHWTIPPQTGALGSTVEKFNIPNNIAMHYFNKSSLARKFINAAATLAEPGWSGWLTLELYNSTDKPTKLIQGQPIGQVVFVAMDCTTEAPYSGKYQNQGNHPVQAKREDA